VGGSVAAKLFAAKPSLAAKLFATKPSVAAKSFAAKPRARKMPAVDQTFFNVAKPIKQRLDAFAHI
jgi:hypothetical protein